MLNIKHTKDVIFTGRYDVNGKLNITFTDFFNIDGKIVQGTGCGSSIEEASINAYQYAKIFDKNQNRNLNNKNTINREDMKGGGSKPISEKQHFVISKMATEIGLDAEQEALYAYGKSLSDLHGLEAHQLIQDLKSKKSR
ncbi:MAG: hypothetical protein IJD16_09060 [Desulfovibrio sp.]|nr:hypothetical protein [Desulfovibrio sp.]